MFLDDQLYEYFESHIKDLPPYTEAIVNLIRGLYKICDEYKLERLTEYSSYSEVHIVFNKIFSAWDLFSKRIPDEHHIFKSFLIRQSYKENVMKDEKMRKILEKAKRSYQIHQRFRI